MKNLFVILILLASLGCTKFGKNVTVKGCVLNPITGEGIPDVEVSLLKGTNGLPGGFKAVKTVYTDANGYFELNKFGLTRYDVRAQAGDRYDLGWYMDGEKVSGGTDLLKVKKGKTMHADYHAVEYGNLLINVENQNCEGPADEMKFQFKTQFDDDFGYFTPVFTGCFSVFPTEGTKTPMGQRIYKLTVTRSSGISYIYDTVFVNSTGTSTVNLFY